MGEEDQGEWVCQIMINGKPVELKMEEPKLLEAYDEFSVVSEKVFYEPMWGVVSMKLELPHKRRGSKRIRSACRFNCGRGWKKEYLRLKAELGFLWLSNKFGYRKK